MSAGPLVAALAGVPAGRGVDRFGAHRMTLVGLTMMTLGAGALALVSPAWGIWGYVTALVTVTAGYAVFQAANNTAVVTGVGPSQRGVVSGLLTLSRNLGLITGASAMGAVFALGSGARDVASTGVTGAVAGTHAAFAVAAALAVVALVVGASIRPHAAQ